MTDKLLDHLKRALGEAYTIERELTGGGMSRVFVARERALGREVVIKVLPKELALGVNRERFQQEVQLAAQLSNPYIVPLLHAGEHEDLLWFTMPFISGESLKQRLEKGGPLPVADVLKYARDVVEALAYAHSRGVIHRDIKPANILVDGGHALVTDFGVAKALRAALPTSAGGHTTTGMAIGTPAYMAPEQLAADPAANHRVDIYAMGLLLYELLAGVSPFATPSPTATMTAQLTQMPTPLNKIRDDVPTALSALITHCLAKSPDDRPSSAEEILAKLDLISGELAAETHRTGGTSRAIRRMIPITAVMAFVAVSAIAAVVYLSRQTPVTPPVVVTPTTVVGGTDDPQAMAINPADVGPKTYQDSLRKLQALWDARSRLDTSQQASSTTLNISDYPKLDSIVNAMVDARMKEAQALAAKQQPAVAVRGGTTIADPGAGFPPGRGPRKVVVETGAGPTRGPPDTMLRVLAQQVGIELTSRLGRNWEVVRRDLVAGNRFEPTRDSTMAGADALVTITLAPDRRNRDSVSLRIMVANTAGGWQLITSEAFFKPTSTASFSATVNRARGLLYSIQMSPRGTAWPQSGPQAGPPQFGGGPDSGFGGRRGGGGGRGGGQRSEGAPTFPNDSGRRGGGGGGVASGGGMEQKF